MAPKPYARMLYYSLPCIEERMAITPRTVEQCELAGLVCQSRGDPYYQFASARNPAYGITHGQRCSQHHHRRFFRKLHLQYRALQMQTVDSSSRRSLKNISPQAHPSIAKPIQVPFTGALNLFASSFHSPVHVCRCGLHFKYGPAAPLSLEKRLRFWNIASYSPHSHCRSRLT